MQEGAVAGEVFAFGISEAGNDLVLFGSDTDAAPQPDGGYAFTGTKIFTSLAPVWTQLGLHGLDTTSPDGPKIVYAFVPRSEEDAGRVVTRDDWDTLGMRARSRAPPSCTVPSPRPTASCGGSTQGPTPTRSCSASSACSSCCSPRSTPGSRAAPSTSRSRPRAARRSKKTGLAYSQDPDIRWRIADMALAYDALPPQLASLSRDVDERADHGARWFSLLAGVKHRAVTTAKAIVDDAVLVAGRVVVLRGLGAQPPVPRRARRAVPPLRPGIGALDRRDRLARAGRQLTPR